MPDFVWSEKYSVNIKTIDGQHKQLIAIINKLHKAILEGRSNEVLLDTLTQLVKYTKEHFDYEETLLKKYDYPGYDQHVMSHKDMRDKVMSMFADFSNGKMLPSLKVMNFLKGWLSSHVLGTDQLYADFLHDEGVF